MQEKSEELFALVLIVGPSTTRSALLLCAIFGHLENKEFKEFIFLNLSATPHLQPFHTKAIALDPDDRNAALPTLFLLHELRARAKYPFQSVDAVLHLSVHAVLPPAGLSKDIEWQDWITSSGILRSSPSSPSILRSSASSPYFRRAAQGA